MKRYIYTFGIIVLIVGILFVVSINGKTKTLSGRGILSVNDIQADPFAYKGIITITGVVAKVSERDPSLFALIETSEAILCKQTGCAKFYLPVKSDGQSPKVWDEVNVSGSFAEAGQLFVGTRVEVRKHLTFK